MKMLARQRCQSTSSSLDEVFNRTIYSALEVLLFLLDGRWLEPRDALPRHRCGPRRFLAAGSSDTVGSRVVEYLPADTEVSAKVGVA